MKKLMFLLALLIGVTSASIAQTSVKQGIENKMAKKKQQPRKQMSHFDKQKSDPNMKHNGTEASTAHQDSGYNVDKKSFNSPKYFPTVKSRGKRVKNKNFNTYTFK